MEQDMRQEPFDLVGRDSFGYHRRQVDEFLARARVAYEDGGGMRSADVRHVSFDAVRGGYRADQVDEVLDRLEDALAGAERDRRIETEGQDAWAARVAASIEVLRGRLDRPAGQRFRASETTAESGYDTADVDALCDGLARTLKAHETSADAAPSVTVGTLRRSTFAASPAGQGYDEAQVDAFLDAAIDVLAVLD